MKINSENILRQKILAFDNQVCDQLLPMLVISVLFSSWFTSCLITDEDLCVGFIISQLLISFYIYVYVYKIYAI